MPSNQLVYRCLVISPSDVDEAREEIFRTCQRWNAQVGGGLQARLEPVAWESHAVPELGGHPQKLFNPEVDSSDLAVAVFWTRLGKATDTHASGSVEEIERMLAAGKPVLIYFCEAPVPPKQIDPAQLASLADFKKDLYAKGIVDKYTTTGELAANLTLHLTSVITKLLMRDRQGGAVMSGALTAPIPDVGVSVTGGQVIFGNRRPAADVVLVDVMNRSPVKLYLSQVAMETEDNKTFIMPMDLYGRTANQVIDPGNSFQYIWDRDALREKLEGRKLRHAVAVDKVGRQWRSPLEEAQKAVEDLPEIDVGS